MPTSKEVFESKMDDLADAINDQAGTTGKKSLDAMISTVQNLNVLASSIEVSTTEPTADYTGGGYKLVCLDSDPATHYNGWIYLIKEVSQ